MAIKTTLLHRSSRMFQSGAMANRIRYGAWVPRALMGRVRRLARHRGVPANTVVVESLAREVERGEELAAKTAPSRIAAELGRLTTKESQ